MAGTHSIADDVLQGKVALVTGAGRGIGRSIALAYAAAGASVCCLARTGAEIDATAGEIRASGGAALALCADVRELPAIEAAIQAVVRDFGGLDIVVIGHGVLIDVAPLEQSDPALWRETLEINLLGAYHVARAAIPVFKARGGGKLIFIGSGQRLRTAGLTSAYACSKAGLWALVQSLATELVDHNISVNELLPGNVRTTLFTEAAASIAAATAGSPRPLAGKVSQERLKEPEEVVPLALFLASQPTSGATGQSFSLHRLG